MTTDPHDRYAELAAGYALHALEPDDEQTFVDHLAGCATCQADVRTGQDTLAALALTLPGTPPRGLREAILDSARADHLPPAAPTLGGRGTRRAAPWLLAAAASVAIVALAATNLTLRGRVRDTRAELAATRAVIACVAPRCTSRWLASPDGTRHAVLLDDGTSARLVIDTLPRNDPGRDMYVLWRQDAEGRMRAVRGFDLRTRGVSTVRVGALGGPYTGFAISLERSRTLPSTPTDPVLLPANG